MGKGLKHTFVRPGNQAYTATTSILKKQHHKPGPVLYA
jgi:hypothetical protein